MEIIVKSGVLKKECEKLEEVLPVKPSITITGGILFDVKEMGCFLTATDLESTIRLNIECEKIKKGSAVVNGKTFISLIKQLPDGDIKISKKNNSVDVICGDAKYTFPSMDEEEFPKLQKFSGDITIKLGSNILREGIDKVRFCIDREEPRPYFRGGLLDIKENTVNIVGTDTKRLTLFTIKTDQKYSHPYKCLLPYKLMGIITSLSNDNDQPIEISIGKNQISFNFKTTYLLSQLLSGSEEFPDYTKVIPTEKQLKRVYINRESLLTILKRISLFTTERYNRVRLSIGKNTLILSVANPDVGDASEKIDIEYNEDTEQNLAFPPNYLIDFLSKLEDAKLVFGFISEKNPVLLRGEKTEGYLYVAMPLKLE
ncbi:MAG TPA: DNA polymerase III subunit beta [bacterium]|mgnify:CR=1 FL=1|nr:DNA polymerase III subunit beta [bacterium]HPP29816.1 DNA polymerase III subunit beta [bacterium]